VSLTKGMLDPRRPAGGAIIADLLADGVVLDVPDRLTDVTSWHGHVPFAFWCVAALRPRVLVELGTHKGDSYSAFCQAVHRLGLPTACYAVDTWRGDHQAGLYEGDEIFAELEAYHARNYGGFSRLVRSTFDEALAQFADGTIDLLHVDGLHTYEAVRHDFESWVPKLSRSAVVLFHDVNVREGDFGVWRLWDELRAGYPHFTLLHAHGLGVLVTGPEAPEPAKRLAACDAEEAGRVRALFARLGEAVALERERSAAREEAVRSAERVAELEARGAAARAELEERAGAVRAGLEARIGELGAELDAAKAELARHVAVTTRASSSWLVRRALRRARRGVARPEAPADVAPARPRSSLSRSFAGLPRRLAHAASVALDVLRWTVTFQLLAGLRRRRYARLIRRSGLFDAAFYLSQCGDDPAARKDPIAHFLLCGAARGLDPHPLFDTSAYLEQHPGARPPRKNPLVHFIRCRRESGRAGSADVAVSSGEVLLRERPYRAPAAAGSGRDVLVVDHRTPTPDQDSGSVRMLALLSLLRRLGHAVAFVSAGPERMPTYEEELRRRGIEVHVGFPDGLALLEAEGDRFGWAILSRPETCARFLGPVRAYAPQATVIYDTVDLHWVRLEREAELTGSAETRTRAERARALERVSAACVDVVLAVTEREREVLLAEVPAARVEVLPNVHATRASSRAWDARDGLMFIGGFEHAPNVDGVRWFVESVLPLVQARLPGTVLHVVGSRAPEEVRRLSSPTVHVAGYVRDPLEYFDGCRVFVAPLRFGAGMKGKIGQAMSHGLPVVTTSIGAEGMGLQDGEHVLVADAPETFADAVVRLHTDRLLWEKLSRRGASHVEEHFSPQAVGVRLEALLQGTAARAAGDARVAREEGSAA
jgi:glycosyltransferase involved in cell wall biosynthesis